MYIGIDVGGTNLKAGLVSESGELLAVERMPLNFQGAEAFAAQLAALAGTVMAAGGAEQEEISCVGVGIPGAVQGGEILYTANIPMRTCRWRRCSAGIWTCRFCWATTRTAPPWASGSSARDGGPGTLSSSLWVPVWGAD